MPDTPDVPEPNGDDMQAQEIELVFGGPLPVPELYRAYEDAVPGTAKWMQDIVEQETRQRHELQMSALKYTHRSINTALSLIALFTLAVLGVAAYLFASVSEVYGGVLGVGDLVFAAYAIGRWKGRSASA